MCPRRKAGVRLESHLPKVVKHKVRDDDVELFGRSEPEHIALLEINPVQEAKYLHVLFRPLGVGTFEAGMIERVNSRYPGVLVEFSTDTAQESKAATHIENPQLLISSERKRRKGIGEHGLHGRTCFLGSSRGRMVVPKSGSLVFSPLLERLIEPNSSILLMDKLIIIV